MSLASLNPIPNPSYDQFFLAAGQGDVDTVRKLLPTLDPTVRCRSETIYKKIFQRCDGIKFHDTNYNTLEIASVKGRIDVVDVLLKDERIRNLLNDIQRVNATVLHIIAASQCREINQIDPIDTTLVATKLLEAGADLFVTDQNGHTALKDAVQWGNIKVVACFLNYERTRKSHFINTCLAPFLPRDPSTTVYEYLNRNLVNYTQNKDKLTPLYFAVYETQERYKKRLEEQNGELKRSIEIVELLLSHDANPHQYVKHVAKTIIQVTHEPNTPPEVTQKVKDKVVEIEQRKQRHLAIDSARECPL